MKDYTNLFIASVIFTIYFILLHNNKLENIQSYIKTLHGRMLVILLILLSLQRNIQIGLMITLAYVLTDIYNKSEQVLKVEQFKNFKTSKNKRKKFKKEKFKDVGRTLQELDEEIKEVFGNSGNIELFKNKRSKQKKTQESFKNGSDDDDILSRIKEKLRECQLEQGDVPPQEEESNEDISLDSFDIEGFTNFTENYSKF